MKKLSFFKVIHIKASLYVLVLSQPTQIGHLNSPEVLIQYIPATLIIQIRKVLIY